MLNLALSPRQVRQATLLLAGGAIGFGLWSMLLPRPFARVFGVPTSENAEGVVPIQSVGARDVVSGIGIISATTHGGRAAPWLLGRLLSDLTDVVWVILAFARGARSWRFGVLGTIALSAVIADYVLYRAHKNGSSRDGGTP